MIVMEDILIPLSFFLLIFAILYVYYTTRHKERMALIEKGADPKFFKNMPVQGSGYSYFKWGLFMVGIAIGVFLGVLFEEYTSLASTHMYISMVLICGGIALMLAYLLREKFEKNKPAE
jgi:hypothetical protein